MKDCPFEAWQLIQAKEILKWIRSMNDFGLNSTNVITTIEDVLFNIAHDKLGLKPIGKCTIQELQEELKRRLSYENVVVPDNNGHDYVDLGLPSGLLWATCNVGANSPEEYGDYFAWGETKPKSSYYESNSVTYGKSMGDIGGNAQYDAARANWGGSWRLPTRAEFGELLSSDNCTWTWTTQNSVNGYKVTSKHNGNSIFLPAAGSRYGTSLYRDGSYGGYWSSTPHEDNPDYAYYLYFGSDYRLTYWSYRYRGRSVRPVSE